MQSVAILWTSALTLSILLLILDTFPATSCMVADNSSASVERPAALPLEALVLFKTSPVMWLIEPELSWIVFKMLFMGVITKSVISFRSPNTKRTQATTAAMPTTREIRYTMAKCFLASEVCWLREALSASISASIASA